MLPELSRVDELARSLERTEVDGGSAERGSLGPQFSASKAGNVWWVRITGQHPTGSSQPRYYYSWQLVYFERGDGDTGEHLDDTSVEEGTYDGVCPAFETTLNKHVPIDGTAIVPAWLAEDGQTLLFSYPVGASGDTTFEGPVTFEGDVTFDGSTTYNGPTIYNDDGSPYVVVADLDDFDLTSFPVQFLDVTGPFALTGIVAGVHGRRIVLCNVGSAILTLKFEHVGSAAASRICTPYTDHADVLLPPNFWVELQYDATAALGVGRWRVLFVSAIHLYGTDEAIGGLAATETDFAIDQRWPFQVWAPAAGGTRLNSLANGERGQWYWISVADGDDALTITHQDAGSTAGNLINCPAKIDYVVPPCGGCLVFYDGAFWNVVGIASHPSIVLIVNVDIVIPPPPGPNLFAILNAALTAVRTVTLPAASAVKAGTTITVVDKAGNLGSTNYLKIERAGSDTINGTTSKNLTTPYSKVEFVSDGSSKWTYNPAAAGAAASLTNTYIGVGDSGGLLSGSSNYTFVSGLTATTTEQTSGLVGHTVTHYAADAGMPNAPAWKAQRAGGTSASPSDTVAGMYVASLVGALRSTSVWSERARIDMVAASATLCDIYFKTYFGSAWNTALKIAGADGALNLGLLTATRMLSLDSSKNIATKVFDPGTFEARLTLTSGTAVTTSDVTAAGTIYLTPYEGNQVAIYDGTNWEPHTLTEISLSLTLTSGKNYDVFVYNNSGTLTLELSDAWTNDTTRDDALALQNGAYVKSGATTRRHVGVIRASGTNTTEDSLVKRFVVNRANAVDRPLFSCPAYADGNSPTSWTTTSTTYEEANAGTGSKLEFLTLGEEPSDCTVSAVPSVSASQARTGIGVDSTTTATVTTSTSLPTGATNIVGSAFVTYAAILAAGYHYFDFLVAVAAASTATYFADLQRLGSSADPKSSFIKATVRG